MISKFNNYLTQKINNLRFLRLLKRMGIQRLKDGSLVEMYHSSDSQGKGNNSYLFSYKFKRSLGGEIGWYSYILKMPSFNGRDDSTYRTHRAKDTDGSYFISWSFPVRTLRDMQTISLVWADSLQEYIATGKAFG